MAENRPQKFRKSIFEVKKSNFLFDSMNVSGMYWNLSNTFKRVIFTFLKLWHIAKATFAHNTKLKNGRKQTSEISKIHFWGRKIKFSFWLNKKRSNAKKQKKGKGNSDRRRMNLRNSRWEFHHDESKIIFIYLIQTITKILQFWLKT